MSISMPIGKRKRGVSGGFGSELGADDLGAIPQLAEIIGPPLRHADPFLPTRPDDRPRERVRRWAGTASAKNPELRSLFCHRRFD